MHRRRRTTCAVPSGLSTHSRTLTHTYSASETTNIPHQLDYYLLPALRERESERASEESEKDRRVKEREV